MRRKKRTNAHPICLACPRHEKSEIEGRVRIVGKWSQELTGAEDGRNRWQEATAADQEGRVTHVTGSSFR